MFMIFIYQEICKSYLKIKFLLTQKEHVLESNCDQKNELKFFAALCIFENVNRGVFRIVENICNATFYESSQQLKANNYFFLPAKEFYEIFPRVFTRENYMIFISHNFYAFSYPGQFKFHCVKSARIWSFSGPYSVRKREKNALENL